MSATNKLWNYSTKAVAPKQEKIHININLQTTGHGRKWSCCGHKLWIEHTFDLKQRQCMKFCIKSTYIRYLCYVLSMLGSTQSSEMYIKKIKWRTSDIVLPRQWCKQNGDTLTSVCSLLVSVPGIDACSVLSLGKASRNKTGRIWTSRYIFALWGLDSFKLLSKPKQSQSLLLSHELLPRWRRMRRMCLSHRPPTRNLQRRLHSYASR